MRKLIATAILLNSLFIISFFPGVTSGDQLQVEPYLVVRGEYDDNIFFAADSDNAETDYILTIRPGILLTDRTERLNATLRAEVTPFFYKDNSDLDDVDQNYRGRIAYQFTPKFYGGADAFYIVDHRPDRDLLATGLVQNANQRDRYHVGGGVGYNLSEITSANLNYDFNRDDWETKANQDDLDTNAVNFGLNHDLSRWMRETTGQLALGYSNVDRDTAESDSFVGSISIRYRLSELFRLRLRGGARYVSSDFDVRTGTDPVTGDPIIEKENNSGWGGVGAAVLGYAGERTRSNLLFSHDLSSGSGRGSPTVLTRLVGSVNYRALEELRIGLSAGVYRNKASSGDFGAREIDQYTFNIRPNVRWEFYDNFSLTAGYRYSLAENRVSNRNTTKNAVFLQLAYGLPLFDFFDQVGTELRQVISGAVPPSEPR